jgi:NADH-quinone oxidoreductase subunit I
MSILGTGILKGLGVTLRHFVETYVEDLRHFGFAPEPKAVRRQNPKNRGLTTIEYPKEKMALPENFRYVPFLVEDTENEEIKCTSCGICAKVCPPQCIWIERTEDPVTKRPVPEPKDFFIDSTICMNCGYCAEFCPFDAIKMDINYELSYYPMDNYSGKEKDPVATGIRDNILPVHGAETVGRLVFDKNGLLKTDVYHATIHPSDWAREVAERKPAPAPAAKPAAAAPAAKPAAASMAAAAPAPAAAAPAAPKPAGAKPGPKIVGRK